MSPLPQSASRWISYSAQLITKYFVWSLCSVFTYTHEWRHSNGFTRDKTCAVAMFSVSSACKSHRESFLMSASRFCLFVCFFYFVLEAAGLRRKYIYCHKCVSLSEQGNRMSMILQPWGELTNLQAVDCFKPVLEAPAILSQFEQKKKERQKSHTLAPR